MELEGGFSDSERLTGRSALQRSSSDGMRWWGATYFLCRLKCNSFARGHGWQQHAVQTHREVRDTEGRYEHTVPVWDDHVEAAVPGRHAAPGPDGATCPMPTDMPTDARTTFCRAMQRRADGHEEKDDRAWDYTTATTMKQRRDAHLRPMGMVQQIPDSLLDDAWCAFSGRSAKQVRPTSSSHG